MKSIYSIILAVLLAGCLFACSDDDNSSGGDLLTLNVSGDTILLSSDHPDDIAVTFTWNKGTDRGNEFTVTYIFRLDVFGNEFTTSTDPIEVPADGEFLVSFTNEELNNLIVKKWKLTPGERVKLEARVVAKLDGPKFEYPEIAIAEFDAESYAIPAQPLYLIGDATNAGNDPSKSIKINELENGTSYNWIGKMQVGKYKFLCEYGNMLPSLNRGADNNTLVERTLESQPDDMFQISEEGTYGIVVLRDEMRITCNKIFYPTVYAIGNAVSGWDLPKDAIALSMDPLKLDNVFTLETKLSPGEFKFLTEYSWGSYTLRPMEADGSINDTGMQGYKDGEDLKWKVKDEEEGNYRITLDINNMTIKFEKI
jgi:hypothetical protein